MDDALNWNHLIFRKDKTMTRITVAANDEILVVSGDSLLTNNVSHHKNYKKKVLHNESVIVALLGYIDIMTSDGVIEFDRIIEGILKEENNPYMVEDRIIRTVRDYYTRYKHGYFLQVCLFWKENKYFLTRVVQLNGDLTNLGFFNYAFGHAFETKEPIIKIMNHYTFDTGEGSKDSLLSELHENPFNFSLQTVTDVVQDKALNTVGGDIFTVSMDKYGQIKEYINGKEVSYK